MPARFFTRTMHTVPFMELTMALGVSVRRSFLSWVLCFPLVAAADMSDATSQLLTAIMANNPAMARTAIDAGADINGDMGEGRTPLIVAAMTTKPALVQLLLERGADPKRRAGAIIGNATTAAFFAMNGVELTGRADEVNPKKHADALEVLRLIAAKRADLDLLVRRGPTQLTALMIAAQFGALDAVQILLDAGADPNATNGGKFTALDYAIDGGPAYAQTSAANKAAIIKAIQDAGGRSKTKR
jgi:ankyrin repeat protein